MARRGDRSVEVPVDTGVARLVPDDDGLGWTLELDATPQSHLAPGDPTRLDFEYVRRAGHVLDLLAGPGDRIAVLHLGGGALTLPRYVAATRPGSRQRVVEVDAALVALVRERLPFDRSIRVRVGDAAQAMAAQSAASVDAVVVDVYAGGRVPASLTSATAWSHLARVLRPGGVVVACLADRPGLAFVRGQLATARTVLPELALLCEPAVLRGRRSGNAVLLAGHHPLPVDALSRRLAADPVPARVIAGEDVRRLAVSAAAVTDETATPGPEVPVGWSRSG